MRFLRSIIRFNAAPGVLALLFLLSACSPQAKDATSPAVATVTPIVLAVEAAAGEEMPPPPEQTASLMMQLPGDLPVAGSEFEVVVMVDTGEQDVDTVQISLNFDPNLLAVVVLEPGSAFPTLLQSTFDNQTGSIDFAAGLLGEKVNGKAEVVRLQLKSLQETPATARLSFHFGLPRETGVYLEGYSVLKDDGAAELSIPLQAPSTE